MPEYWGWNDGLCISHCSSARRLDGCFSRSAETNACECDAFDTGHPPSEDLDVILPFLFLARQPFESVGGGWVPSSALHVWFAPRLLVSKSLVLAAGMPFEVKPEWLPETARYWLD